MTELRKAALALAITACAISVAHAQGRPKDEGAVAGAEATHPPDPTDPALRALIPASLKRDPSKQAMGATMQTNRPYGDVLQSCLTVVDETTCTITGAARAEGKGGQDVAATWQYGYNEAREAILLVTVQGKPDEGTPLRIVYGAGEAAADVSRKDFLGAVQHGGRIYEPRRLGCRENCVYGLLLSDAPGLLERMRHGDGVGLQVSEDRKVRNVTASTTGFGQAVEGFDQALTRRLDPGTPAPR